MTDRLCKRKIQDGIFTDICDIIIFDSIDSTNSYGKNYVLSGNPCPAMILSESQFAGRGRCGRSFFSPDATGLYMSILYCSDTAPEDALFSTVAAGVASAIAIEELTGKKIQIKWVNDIYLDGKKAGGILCESVLTEGKMGIVVGIGINISTTDFPDFDNNSPISVGELDRNVLAGKIYDKFMLFTRAENRAACIEEYKKRFYLLDKEIKIHYADGTVSIAVARGIDDRGGLVVEYENGKADIIRTGEVTVREK